MKLADMPVFLSIILASSAILAGCDNLDSMLPASPPPKPEGTIVAKVNNVYITLEQLNKEIEGFKQMYDIDPTKQVTKDEKVAFLKEELIPRYMFYKEARARKLDNDPKVQETLFNLEVRVLDEAFLKDAAGEMTASPQEIENFYNSYKDRFKQVDERRVREIMVNTEDEAKDILIEILKGGNFNQLAQDKSKAESAAKGGDLGYIKKGQLGDDYKRFDDVAFNLERGQTSSIFKDKKGFYIIRVDDIRGGGITPLSDVRDQVKSAVIYLKQQQKMQELRDSLSKKSKVELYQEKVK